ncbi:hypothetical protein D3C84_1156810 [compost metagenome]
MEQALIGAVHCGVTLHQVADTEVAQERQHRPAIELALVAHMRQEAMHLGFLQVDLAAGHRLPLE